MSACVWAGMWAATSSRSAIRRDLVDRFDSCPHGVLVSWVEIDPQRAPLVRWALEQYATGDWTIMQLVEVLRDKGLTTRKTSNCQDLWIKIF